MTKFVLKSYNYSVLETYIAYLQQSKNNSFAIVNLPRRIKKITLLRSPHVYKKAKVQYQETIYTTVLTFDNTNSILGLNSIVQNLPKAISLKIVHI